MSFLDQKDLLTWCDDLHQVKGNVSQLQATLNQILTKAPTLEQFKQLSLFLDNPSNSDPRSIADKTKNLLISSQLKVAIRLKHLYDQGLLPLLLALSKINFKSSKADKFVGYFLDYAPPANIGASLPDVLKKNIKSDKTIDLYSYPPTLPPISNESLLNKVLTDKSYRQPSDFLESATADDFNRAHNAKLSIKGRTLLELIIFDILESRFPDIHEDDLYLFRHKLLSKTILTKLAFGYNLVDQYKYHLSDEIDLEDKLEIFCNLFLAYIAGLSLDDYTFDEIKIWINKLYDPIIAELNDSINIRPLNKLALSELNFLFKQVTNIYSIPPAETTFEFTQLESDPFVVKLLINGESLGIGTSSVSFDEAKERAAADSLDNKKKIDKILKMLIDTYRNEDDKSPKEEEDSYSPKLEGEEFYVNEPIPKFNEENTETNNILSNTSNDNSNDNQGQSNNGNYTNGLNHNNIASNQNNSTFLQPYGAPPQPYNNHAVAPYTLTSIDPNQRYGVDNNAKNNLYALLGARHLAPTYRFHKTGNDFQATVLVNDNMLGVGYDVNKKIASQKAAMNALTNITVLQQLGINK